jgi:EAL domain-containing protein (putative c-di-GMP-specific phosphodiesterase class I)
MVVLVSAEHSSILTAAERVARAYGMRLLGSVAKPVTRAALHALVAGALAETAGAAPGTPVRIPGPSVVALSAAEIRSWIGQGHLSVDLQPKLELASGAVGGAEALARLFSPVAGLRIPPGRFVPVIETDPALTADFTLAVTRTVAGALAAWPVGTPPPTLSINLAGSSLADPALADRLAETLDHAGIAPARIVWEVTETAALESMGAAIEILTRLRLKGSGLSIDDYGTGHSSLGRLAAIPFTEVKLDRAFVHGCVADRSARTIIASTVRLAHDLGMKCVAEGAETDDEVDVLRDLGCDAVQGYAVARPMPVDAFAAWCLAR